MCGFCSLFGGTGRGHWSEVRDPADAGAPGARWRERLASVAKLNRVLARYALVVDDWQGGALFLRSRTGAGELVADLGELWPAAERLARRRCDPLDPRLLDDLSRRFEDEQER